MSKLNDAYWMQQALLMAYNALYQGEVPIGAVLILDLKVIGWGWNCPITNHDPSAHAEIIALRQGGKILHNYRLINTTLYVTLEPCIMCAGAIVHSRIKRLVYGASNIKMGATKNFFDIFNNLGITHQIEITAGTMVNECTNVLDNFFKKCRQKKSL
ncbi:tRNA adenosine(34) deaminase TadA [Candidatus Profftia sp. (ex Adelges kitamiensis)]|uniref:tRNA adenosine(34) deaminase TadA n=1 Tax=Candidatus Profftia sp. (ex Adelges kitamiensis) TaxID=2864218 RepID=UPI001CE2A4A9|nr:tRNA adenosine(34) deaminase TadA [Candidatus Profftia sp. (ex Adelges kitamiensis)]